MEDYDALYREIYHREKQAIENEFKAFSEENPDLFESQKWKKFSRILGERKDNLVSKCIQHSSDRSEVKRNMFLSELVVKFSNRNAYYRRNPVSNFLSKDLHDLRKSHIQRYEENKSSTDYQWNADFMYKAGYQEVIELLAKYFSIEDAQNSILKYLDSNDVEVKDKKKITIKASGIKRQNKDGITSLTAFQTGILHQTLLESKVYLNQSYLTKTSTSEALGVLTSYHSDSIKAGLEIKFSLVSGTDKQAIREILKKALKMLE